MVPRNADTLGRGVLSIPSRIARRKAGSGAPCFGKGYISSVSREFYSSHFAMAAYDYYRSSVPGWGTSQVRVAS